jgi:hypothetical protein
MRRRRIEPRLGQGTKAHPHIAKGANYGGEIRSAPSEPRKVSDNEYISWLKVFKTRLPPRPGLRYPRSMLLEDFDSPRSNQSVDLGNHRLVLGAHPGIANNVARL